MIADVVVSPTCELARPESPWAFADDPPPLACGRPTMFWRFEYGGGTLAFCRVCAIPHLRDRELREYAELAL